MSIVAQDARARITWPALRGLVAGYNLYGPAAPGGAIDWETPLSKTPIAARRADGRGAGGLGYGPLGGIALGYGPGGPGLGFGPLGYGPLGYGTFGLTWTSGPLADGAYTFAVVALDAAGNWAATDAPEANLNLAGTPKPPGKPTAADYDAGTDALTLAWALSRDDEAA